MNVGERYLLFLKRSDDKQFFYISGGPDGQLVVKESKVYSLSQLYKDDKIIDLKIDGEPIDNITAKLKKEQ